MPRLTKSQRGLRERPPENSMTPIASSMAKAVIPRSEFGNPKTSPCHEVATLVQLTNGLRLQGRSAVGFLINLIVSIVSANEATSPIIEPIINI